MRFCHARWQGTNRNVLSDTKNLEKSGNNPRGFPLGDLEAMEEFKTNASNRTIHH
jgi:hypothetical protein